MGLLKSEKNYFIFFSIIFIRNIFIIIKRYKKIEKYFKISEKNNKLKLHVPISLKRLNVIYIDLNI